MPGQPAFGQNNTQHVAQPQRAHQVDQEGQKAQADRRSADDGGPRIALEFAADVECSLDYGIEGMRCWPGFTSDQVWGSRSASRSKSQ